MTDFIEKILGYFEIIWEFLIGTFEAFFQLIVSVGQSLNYVIQLIPVVPTILGISIGIVLYLSILKFILGR